MSYKRRKIETSQRQISTSSLILTGLKCCRNFKGRFYRRFEFIKYNVEQGCTITHYYPVTLQSFLNSNGLLKMPLALILPLKSVIQNHFFRIGCLNLLEFVIRGTYRARSFPIARGARIVLIARYARSAPPMSDVSIKRESSSNALQTLQRKRACDVTSCILLRIYVVASRHAYV